MAPKKLSIISVASKDSSTTMDFDNILDLCDLDVNKKVLSTFSKNLSSQLDKYHQQLSTIASFAPLYDSKTGVKANGFRSFIKVAVTLLRIITKVFQRANEGDSYSMTSLTFWIRTLDYMTTINEFLLEIHDMASSEPNRAPEEPLKLFPDDPDLRANSKIESLSLRISLMDCSQLYGRGRGFHIDDPDIRKFTGTITFGLAWIADLHESTLTGTAQRMLESRIGFRYLTDPEFLAARVSEAIKELPVEFCQNFYSLNEGDLTGKALRRAMGPIKTNHVIKIPPEPLKTIRQDGSGFFEVPIPTSHIGLKEISARLLSPFRTVDMIGGCKVCFQGCSCKVQPSSNAIFFHMHGGGFIAQTSKSHETYLRQWSRDSGVPILSIDYSLAPQAPYPRALEEIFYAYNWMLQNFPSLGTTGEFILVGGDSAGGNFSSGLTLKCLEARIRPPNSLLMIYPALLCQMYPSPSRLFCLFDPLVMFPFLLRCLNSYADPHYNSTCPRTFVQELNACKSYTDPLLSPIYTPTEVLAKFPPVHLITTEIDPCLDEVITFSNRLVDVGNKVTLEVISGLPHGFLSLNSISQMSNQAVEYISRKIQSIIASH